MRNTRRPTTGAMPRHIVSTSGNSGMRAKALNEPIPRSNGRYPHASEEPQRHFPGDVLYKELNCVDFTAYRAVSSITPGNRRCVPSSIVGHRYAASQAEEASFNGHFRPHTGKSFTIGKPFRIVPDSQIVRIMPGRPEMPRIPMVPADSVE